MAGNITYLRGSRPGHWPNGTQKEGAYYYVQGGSIRTYKKASVLITLPTSKRLKYRGDWGRNAYISLGADGGSAGAIDIGIRNCARDEDGNVAPDQDGLGWEAFCYQCKTDKYSDDLHPTIKAPAGTVRAKVEVTPDLTTGKQITLYVQWLDGSNREIDAVNQTFDLKRTYNWTVFYRFASLPTNDPNASMTVPMCLAAHLKLHILAALATPTGGSIRPRLRTLGLSIFPNANCHLNGTSASNLESTTGHKEVTTAAKILSK